MKIKLLQFGKFYIRLDIPLDVSELILGIGRFTGMYQACTDETLSDCRIYKFSEFIVGVIVINICIGKEEQISEEELNKINEKWDQTL